MSGRRGTTALALAGIILALLLGAVVLAATLFRAPLEPTAKDVVVKMGESMKRGVKATIYRGLLGFSLNAWLTLHDLYGYGENVNYMVGVGWDNNVNYESTNTINVRPCICKKTESLGLPPTFERLNATYKKIILHTSSGGVVEAEYRPSTPPIDEVYPCMIDAPESRVYTVVVKVWLVDCRGQENACGGCNCYSYKFICEKPFCDPSDPPRGDPELGASLQTYGILELSAQKQFRYQNKDYVFDGWFIEMVPPKQGSGWYYNTTLRLFVDDRYHIKLVYKQVC